VEAEQSVKQQPPPGRNNSKRFQDRKKRNVKQEFKEIKEVSVPLRHANELLVLREQQARELRELQIRQRNEVLTLSVPTKAKKIKSKVNKEEENKTREKSQNYRSKTYSKRDRIITFRIICMPKHVSIEIRKLFSLILTLSPDCSLNAFLIFTSILLVILSAVYSSAEQS